jgi:hypothetical protein
MAQRTLDLYDSILQARPHFDEPKLSQWVHDVNRETGAMQGAPRAH